MNEENFSWVQTHFELVKYLMTKENNQKDLIELLKSVGIGPFNDKENSSGYDTELDEIDPFTFFCYIYKYGQDKRLKLLQALSEKINISVPTDEKGIPSAQPQNVWLFPVKYLRTNNEIKRLWSFFFRILDETINDEDYQDVLDIKNTGKIKITEALFYVNPKKYLPINSPMKSYLKEIYSIDTHFENYSDYLNLLKKIQNVINLNFYEISYNAWKWYETKERINYWIFQGNPKVFDVEKALKENLIDDWTVSAHKNRITKGDKVIIWITGEKAGCYALAEVKSKPYTKNDSKDDHLWLEKNKNELKVDIKITHNLINNPLLKNVIDNIDELQDLKVGKQGTNFDATEDEYNTVLELVENQNIKKYWLYSPGENAIYWEDFYTNGIIGLGWDDLGDLNKYQNKNQIIEKLQELENTNISKRNDSTANWEFVNDIKIGDVIIVKKGRRELIGYGIIQSDYYYDENRKDFKKCRKIEWKKKGSWKTNFDLAIKTLTNITNYRAENSIYGKFYEQLLAIMEVNIMSKYEQNNYPLNTIFYGPPGTGKTYHTILRAAEIIENRKIDSFEEALNIFKLNLHKRIEFITFHQNFSYEDFIQGLRPDVEKGSNLSFEKKDGIFTKISFNALFEYYKILKNKLTVVDNHSKNLNEIYLDFIEYLKQKEIKEFQTSTGSTIYISSFSENENINFKHKDSSRSYTVSGNRLIKLHTIFPKIEQIKNVHNDIREAIGGCNTTVFWVALKEFNNFIELTLNNISSTEELNDTYEEIDYETIKKLLSTINLDELREIEITKKIPNYVLIIDEINRANISRVFGELITLLEPEKRSHGSLPLEVCLPSGDLFIVPSNLFIIGTMNTADKSIALLDVALRRRFEFEAMYPLYEIKGQEIYDKEILEKINKQIIKTKGYDFQIGHSYFMGEENKDRVNRINKKVIPLLLEYYMNDEKEVRALLTNAGLNVDEKSWPLKIKNEND